MLDEELVFFEEQLGDWLVSHRDRVALIKGRRLVGLYDDEEQAVLDGARQFGLQPFLAKRIQQTEDEVTAPALTLGILRADHSVVRTEPTAET